LKIENFCAIHGELWLDIAYRAKNLSFQCLTGQFRRLSSTNENVVDSRIGGAVGSENDLELQGHGPQSEEQFRIGLIAKGYDGVFEEAGPLSEDQKDLIACDDMIKGLCDALANQTEVNAIVLKIEDYGTISRLFNLLSLFRLRCPSLPIIFASSEFRGDDFGPERLTLCDASIQLPTTRATLLEAFLVSQENNAIWVARCNANHVESADHDERNNAPTRLRPLLQLHTIAGISPHHMPRKSRRRKLTAARAPAS